MNHDVQDQYVPVPHRFPFHHPLGMHHLWRVPGSKGCRRRRLQFRVLPRPERQLSPITPAARDFGAGQGRFYQGLPSGSITRMTEDKPLGTGFKVFAGLRVFKYFGIEIGMADYGMTSYTAEMNGGQILNKGEYSDSANHVAGVLTFPLSDGSQVFVKAGQAKVEASLSETFQNASGVVLSGVGPCVTSVRSRHPLIGGGFTMPYGSGKGTALRFEVEHLGEIGAPYEFQVSPGRPSVLTL